MPAMLAYAFADAIDYFVSLSFFAGYEAFSPHFSCLIVPVASSCRSYFACRCHYAFPPSSADEFAFAAAAAMLMFFAMPLPPFRRC